MTRVRALIALLAGLAMVAGCTTIPTSGPVERVSAAPGRINSGVEIAPATPARGASAIEVVEGFLHAMAAVEPDYSVARTYLTGTARDSWDPSAGVRVYAEGSPPIVTEQGARLSAPLVGVVDAQGGFTESGGRLDHDFGLVRDADGQWRIATPPEGIVLSEYLFRSTFVRVPVYFRAAGQRWLVPDARYFPRGRQALERAAAAVVGGPTAWSIPMVDAPQSGRRVIRATLTPAGVAEVVVEGGVPGPEQASTLAAQLAWTLRGFDAVAAFRVLDAAGVEWPIPGYEGRPVPVVGTFTEADPQNGTTSRQLFGVVGGSIVRINDGNQGIDTIPLVPSVKEAGAIAVRHDVTQVAVAGVGGDGLWLAAPAGGELTEVLAGRPVRRPHFSRLDELWVADAAGRLGIVAGGKATTVPAPDLPVGAIVALRVSPDAARIALVVRRADGRSVVGIAGIVRGVEGVRVVGWRQLAIHGVSNDPLDVVDVGWRTADALLLLVADGRGTTIISLYSDGSAPVVVGPPGAMDLVELAVAPGVTPVVRSADGRLYRYYADYRWTSFATEVQRIAYAG